MAYTPPAGNAINFVFVNPGYSPPAGNAIHFVFGGSTPPPPPGNPALPTGLSFVRREIEDEWRPPSTRQYAIFTTVVLVIVPYQRPVIFRETEDDWFPPRMKQYAVVTTVTLQDSINISILW